MKKKVLIVVDYQRDFYLPEGRLYVPGGETIKDNIEKIIPDFDDVIFTLDWHPENHCSFDINGGQWPIHCVKYTEGATVPQSMIDLAKNFHFVYKGNKTDEEEYGAFTLGSSSGKILKDFADYDVVICGLAGDFCVMETIKNVCRIINPKNVKIFMDGIKFIGVPDRMRNWAEMCEYYDFERYE